MKIQLNVYTRKFTCSLSELVKKKVQSVEYVKNINGQWGIEQDYRKVIRSCQYH